MKTADFISAFTPAERLPLDTGALAPGQIALANEARFTSTHLSEALTAYAVGWKDGSKIEAVLDFLCPPIQVPRRFSYRKAENAEAFYSETDDIRSIGADFKKVEYKGTSVDSKTLNKGLTVRIDLDEVNVAANWREQAASRLLTRILRNELRRAATAVSAAANNSAKTWDTTAGKDPDQDVLTQLTTAADKVGVKPNRVLYGDTAWAKRILAHRAQSTSGGFASAGLTPEQVAMFLGVDGVMVSYERYSSSSTARTGILNNLVFLFLADDNMTTEDPSSTKRFWSPVEGGGKWRVYEQQITSKLVDITVEHYSNVVVTSSTGLEKLTIS